MELQTLLEYLLPKELFTYFELVKIEDKENDVLLLHIDEKLIKPQEHSEKVLISKGFDSPVQIQDFPIRDRVVYLRIRRRKWKDKNTGKIYTTKWDLTANGTKYTKEFAAFLKEILRQLPHK